MNIALRSEDWQFHMNDQRDLMYESSCRWLQWLRNPKLAITAIKGLLYRRRKPLISACKYPQISSQMS